MLNLDMRLDGKITSVNKIYLRGKYGGVYLAPEVAQYRKDIKPVVEKYYKESGSKYEGGLLTMKVHVYDNFFIKGHEIRRLDIDNFAKQIIDSIFPALKIDDKAIFNLTLKKVHYDKGQPYIIAKITESPKGNPKKTPASKKVTKKL